MTGLSQCVGCGADLEPNKAPGRKRVWCSDRCRKVTLYSRSCVDCGTRINTDGSVRNAAERCVRCGHAHKQMRSRQWILESVAEWVELFETPPSATDWNPTMARDKGMEWKAVRYEQTGRPWPSPTLVMDHFGSWNAGLEAAGYPPVKPGEYRDGRTVADISRARGPWMWTRAAVLLAADEWVAEHGRFPSSYDWRWAGEGHPSYVSAKGVFGSWGAFREAYYSQQQVAA